MIKLAIPLLHISDPLLAEIFYCDKLGFTKTFDYRPLGVDGPCYFGMMRDDIRIHLSSFPEDGKAGNAIILIVDGVDALYKEYSQKDIDRLPPTNQSGEIEKCILLMQITTAFALLSGDRKIDTSSK
jgi:hypothetical protein